MFFDKIILEDEKIYLNEENDFNYVNSTLQYMQEDLKIWNEIKTNMIKIENIAISENNDNLLIMGIKNFFKQIIEFLISMRNRFNKIWIKFYNYVPNNVGSMYFNDYDKRFINANIKKKPFRCFKYTITDKVPNLKINHNLLKDFTQNNLSNLSSDIIDSYRNNFNYYNEFIMGQILNCGRPIKKELYLTELFKVFRNNKSEKGKIILKTLKDKAEILVAIKNFQHDKENLNIIKQNINKQYDIFINYFNYLSKLSSSQTSNLNTEMYLNSNYDLINAYGDVKSKMAKSILNSYELAFSMKVEALKERYKEYNIIVMTVLNSLQNK